jgi:hypothetical protein
MGAPLPGKNRSKNRYINAGGVQQADGGDTTQIIISYRPSFVNTYDI